MVLGNCHKPYQLLRLGNKFLHQRFADARPRAYLTMIVPIIKVWNWQWYANVPALVNVKLKVPPWAPIGVFMPESKLFPSSLVTV